MVILWSTFSLFVIFSRQSDSVFFLFITLTKNDKSLRCLCQDHCTLENIAFCLKSDFLCVCKSGVSYKLYTMYKYEDKCTVLHWHKKTIQNSKEVTKNICTEGVHYRSSLSWFRCWYWCKQLAKKLFSREKDLEFSFTTKAPVMMAITATRQQ